MPFVAFFFAAFFSIFVKVFAILLFFLILDTSLIWTEYAGEVDRGVNINSAYRGYGFADARWSEGSRLNCNAFSSTQI